MKLSDEKDVKASKIKLTVKYTLVTIAIVILLIVAFYIVFSNALYKNFDLMLENKAISIANQFVGREETAIEDLKSIASTLKNYNLGEQSLVILNSKGNILYENIQEKFNIPQPVSPGFYTVKSSEAGDQKSIRAYITEIGNTGYFVLVAQSYDNLDSSLRSVLLSFLIVIPFILFITILFSYKFANEAIKPLEESIKRLKQFTSDASHELKTPVSTIKANIEVALMKERDPTYYKEKLSTILDSVNRMSKLIQDMLYISRLDMGTYPVKFEPINLNELLENISSSFEGLALSKGVKLIVQKSNNIITNTDKDLLFQILSILVENCIQYNKENGFVKMYTEVDGSFVKINIEDSGIGIDEKDIPYIFDRFYRGEKSRSRETGGVGLGLSVAKELSSLIGGKIQVESKIGVGSKFTLILRRG